MEALMWTGARQVEKTTVQDPELNPDTVLIKVKQTGICGSDVHAYLNQHRFRRPPAILGHEVVGTVEAVGKKVTSVNIGDYATVNPQVACGECSSCAAGHENLCRNKIVPGTDAWIGTFVQYFPAAEKTVIKLPETMSPQAGVLIEPIAVAVHAVKRVPSVKDRRVTVMGAGPIGHLIAVVARHYGAKEITCVDVDPVALEAAEASNFRTVDPRKEEIKPAEIVFLTAGYPQSVNDALKATDPRGKIVVVSMYEGEIPIDIYKAVFHEIDLLGSMTYVHNDFIDAVEIADANPDVTRIVSEPISFDQAANAFAAIIDGRRTALKTTINPFI